MSLVKLATPDGVILRPDSAVVVTNTNLETTILTYTVTGGSMNMSNRLKGTLYFGLSTIAVLPGTLTIRIKYGSSVLTLGGGALALIGGAASAPFVVNFRLSNKDTAGSQFLYGQILQGSGGLTLSSPINQAFSLPAIDSTVDQTFIVTAQFQTANVGNTLTLQDAEAELS